MTGLTAEKHDSFLAPTDGGGAVAEFSGKELIQGEPDASSFPSGGIRATFEARGYTAWDPTSPAFILENPNGTTLCIPTAFCSWTGEALDKKTPLLRSMEALSKQAVRILRLFGTDGQPASITTVGPEQEYFLIDKNFYFAPARPDQRRADALRRQAAQGSGAGRPVLRRHPRARPGLHARDRDRAVQARRAGQDPAQRGRARPVRDRADLRERQRRHRPQHAGHGDDEARGRPLRPALLLHEKPFAGINGSGKHVNWSMADDHGNNLLKPGDTPHDNAQFLVFLVAVIRAVAKHGDLLRVAVARAGNDHRLGANEAPPAIISIFLGDMLQDIVEQIEEGGAKSAKAGGELEIGVTVLPTLPRDAGDRNRTSPFAFTGNKFEFRAVGSAQSIAGPNVVLNTIVAEIVDEIATQLEKAVAAKKDLNTEIQKLLQAAVKESKTVLFNGDNYSEDWHKRPSAAGCPTGGHRRQPARPGLAQGRRSVHQVRRPERARAALPVRDLPGKLQQDDQHRVAADDPDRPADDPSGRPAPPGPGRRGRCQSQGHRRDGSQDPDGPAQRAGGSHRRAAERNRPA